MSRRLGGTDHHDAAAAAGGVGHPSTPCLAVGLMAVAACSAAGEPARSPVATAGSPLSSRHHSLSARRLDFSHDPLRIILPRTPRASGVVSFLAGRGAITATITTERRLHGVGCAFYAGSTAARPAVAQGSLTLGSQRAIAVLIRSAGEMAASSSRCGVPAPRGPGPVDVTAYEDDAVALMPESATSGAYHQIMFPANRRGRQRARIRSAHLVPTRTTCYSRIPSTRYDI